MSQHFFMPALLRARLVLLALAMLLAAEFSLAAPTATATTVARSSTSISDAVSTASPRQDRLERLLAKALVRARRASHAPGMSMAIVADDGLTWTRASGTDVRGRKLSPGAPQTIASITKTFTGTLVMQLVDEGLIQLDVPASRYLPGVQLLRQVTVRQLLAHTSGVADLYGPAKFKLHHRPWRALNSNQVLRPIGPSWFAPGGGYAYSNTNYYLLGLIVESVTGRRFGKVLAERITGPLGLERTRLLSGGGQLPRAWSSTFWTSGAMIATPAELARFGHALYGGGLVSERSLAQMTDFRSGHRYGLGTQLLPLGRQRVPGHSGLLYQTTSLLVHLPAQRVTIAIFGTAPHTDLETALVKRYGSRSILELAIKLAR